MKNFPPIAALLTRPGCLAAARWPALLIGVAALVVPVTAFAAPPDNQAEFNLDDAQFDQDDVETAGIADANLARIRTLDGAASLQRYENDANEPAAVNAPIYSGDALATEADGRAEIQLSTGSLLRIDHDSRVTFLTLPGSYTAGDRAALLQMLGGSLEIEVRGEAPRKGEFQIDVPGASISLLSNGAYRIDVEAGPNGTVRVSTRRGIADVAGDGRSVVVRSGQRTSIDTGQEPEDPRSFNTASADDFEIWIEDRNERFIRTVRSNDDSVDEERIPDSVRPYESELDSYGRWVDTTDYGTVWVPSNQGSDWTPYSNGYWDDGPYGAFWVSNDPWGWAPYHYGRWTFHGSYGWAWCPGSIFAPAWVSWYYGPSYVGWCPLGFWDNPCRIGRVSWGFDFHSWRFCDWNHLYGRRGHRTFANQVHVRREIVGGRGIVVRRAVRIRPADLRDRKITPAQVVRDAHAAKGRGIVDMRREGVRDPATRRPFREREKVAIAHTRSVFPGASRPSTDRVRGRDGERGVLPRVKDGRGGVTSPAQGNGGVRRSGTDARRREPVSRDRSNQGEVGGRNIAKDRARSGRSSRLDNRPMAAPSDRDRRPAPIPSDRLDRGRPRSSVDSTDRRSRPAPSWDDRFARGRAPAAREGPQREMRPRDPRADRNEREFFRQIDRRPSSPRAPQPDRANRAGPRPDNRRNPAAAPRVAPRSAPERPSAAGRGRAAGGGGGNGGGKSERRGDGGRGGGGGRASGGGGGHRHR